ncbi:hypothetical protein C8J44_3111 [Sphingomonas sp. PP-CE-3A-406]|nr:hypothetical protein C8J47_2111 [Sphingomonas sp. PP-F2F-G114-C0414]RMB52084.1 hypothetical protein C8J44_3111 [Sphingomonas sp. PP-CE-3A-406]TCP72667.1 hypothetical protein C8J43_101408 [Sphingomonas sp. PP-CE-1G-424]
MLFTAAFQPIFKSSDYLSRVRIERGPPAPIRGFK